MTTESLVLNGSDGQVAGYPPAGGPIQSAITYEKIPTHIYADAKNASRAVAHEIAELIRLKQREGKMAVLGLATGSSPKTVYAELVRMHREEGLSFQNVMSFNLDEYYPMEPNAVQSYWRFMREQLFDHVDIPAGNYYVRMARFARKKSPSSRSSTKRRSTRPVDWISSCWVSAVTGTSVSTSRVRSSIRTPA